MIRTIPYSSWPFFLSACYEEVDRPLTADFTFVLADSSHTLPATVNFSTTGRKS